MNTRLHTLRPFIPLMAVIASAVGLSSCDSKDSTAEYLVQEWATYTGSLTGKAEFEVQRTGNGPVYTLIANQSLGSTLQTGTRMLISYEVSTLDALPTSGEIELVGCSAILCYKPEVVDMDTIPDWNEHAIYLEYAMRTGGYINLMTQSYVNESDLSKTYTLYVDHKSLDTKSPQLYLRYNYPRNSIQEGRVPMSLDVRTLWSRDDSFDGVTLNINNSNLPSLNVLDFPRSAENYIEP